MCSSAARRCSTIARLRQRLRSARPPNFRKVMISARSPILPPGIIPCDAMLPRRCSPTMTGTVRSGRPRPPSATARRTRVRSTCCRRLAFLAPLARSRHGKMAHVDHPALETSAAAVAGGLSRAGHQWRRRHARMPFPLKEFEKPAADVVGRGHGRHVNGPLHCGKAAGGCASPRTPAEFKLTLPPCVLSIWRTRLAPVA